MTHPSSLQQSEAGVLTRGLRAAGRFLVRLPLPLALLPAVLWALLIWDLSSRSTPVRTGKHIGWEFLSNLFHAPLFGILTLLVAAVVLREPGGEWPRSRGPRWGAVLAITLGYGLLDELHQSQVPGRDGSPLDVLTDFVSALAVLWIVATLGRPELSERMLVRRLGLGILACVACAGAATL